MTRTRFAILVIALALVAVSWRQIAAARTGLTVRHFSQDGRPYIFLAPQGNANLPGVLAAHGFSGSKQLMLGYGHVLARAGYAVLLWDFAGHGANPERLGEGSLQTDIDAAYAVLTAQPEVDAGRVALLGHSMGSGAVMTAGIAHPERFSAVVAISPTGAEVTPSLPPNLLLQAGGWEGRFVANAEKLLAAGGGPNDQFATGMARRLIVIPSAEHISILFRSASHNATLAWLNGAFGLPPQSPPLYTDRRILWYALHLAAWLVAIIAVAPVLRSFLPRSIRPTLGRRSWLGLAAAPILASLLLAGANRLADLSTLGGVRVGGTMALWFGLAGLLWMLIGNLHPGRPSGRSLALGLGLFIVLTVTFGVMAQAVWLQWGLIPARLWLWPLLALGVLPWFLAAGRAQAGASGGRRLGLWLAQSLALVAGLILVVLLMPGMFFVSLLLPLVPIVFIVLVAAGAGFEHVWAYGLGSALFFGWMLAAVFPLAGG